MNTIERMQGRIDKMAELEMAMRDCAQLLRELGDDVTARIYDDEARDMADNIREHETALDKLIAEERERELSGALAI